MTGDDRREQAITFTSDDPVVLDKLIRGELEEGSLFRESTLAQTSDFCASGRRSGDKNCNGFIL